MITATKEELMKLTKANLIELAQKENVMVDESKSKAELVEELLKVQTPDTTEAPTEESQEGAVISSSVEVAFGQAIEVLIEAGKLERGAPALQALSREGDKLQEQGITTLTKEQCVELLNKVALENVVPVFKSILEGGTVEEALALYIEQVAESEINEAPDEAPLEGALAKAAEEVTKTAMELELARRKARFNTGISNEGKSSHDAFKAELARRSAKYGAATIEPATSEEMQSALKQELARREALKK